MRLTPACLSLPVALLASLAPLHALGAESTFAKRTLDDTKAYFTAPLRWDGADWTQFGGTVALIAASHEFDGKVRDHFREAGAELSGKDPHSSRDALPAAAIVAGTWVYAALIRDADGYGESWNMLEAAGLSSASAYALKFVGGRERPNETNSVDAWGAGGSSFPSLHTTAAFAIGTVLAESGNDSWRWARRLLGYGLGVGTAYRRLDGNVHWLSDTVTGAAIGVATADFVLKRREHSRRAGRFDVTPVDGGLVLSWTLPMQ